MAVESFHGAKENICWGCCFFFRQILEQFRETINTWCEQEGFITLDLHMGATLLLKPGFRQKQGLDCHVLWDDTGLLPQGKCDSRVKNTARVPWKRRVADRDGACFKLGLKGACAASSYFSNTWDSTRDRAPGNHPPTPRQVKLGRGLELKHAETREALKAAFAPHGSGGAGRTRVAGGEGRSPVPPSSATGHLRWSCLGRCCGGRGTRRGTLSSPDRPSLPARRGERWTPPPPPATLGCPSARTPAGTNPATVPDEGRREPTGRARPRTPHPPTFTPQTCTARYTPSLTA